MARKKKNESDQETASQEVSQGSMSNNGDSISLHNENSLDAFDNPLCDTSVVSDPFDQDSEENI